MPLFIAQLLLIAGIAAYLICIRPWQLRWGSTSDESAARLPGDEIVAAPSFNATRAVTIDARPDRIYPWIVQMGVNRAGWYSYDMLDNLGRPSAERILPQFQAMQEGTLIPMSPDGKQGLWVKAFHAPDWVLWWDRKGDTSWLWWIQARDPASSRLITRLRVKYRWFSPTILFSLIIEFFDLVMMRQCMLGIKRRAEALAAAELLAA